MVVQSYLEIYGPILTAAGFDPTDFDDGDMFLTVGALLRCGALETLDEMSPEEKAALRENLISSNRFLQKKFPRP
jgi:hypothetical protein